MSTVRARWDDLAQCADGSDRIAQIVDPALRRHFRHASSIGTFSVNERSHKVVPKLLEEVLSEYCNVPASLAGAVRAALLTLPDPDGFYRKSSTFINRTAWRAAMTTFWDSMHISVASSAPLESVGANAACEETLSWATRLCAEQGLTLFWTLTDKTPLFRARAATDGDLLSAAYDDPAGSLGAPPPGMATAQRLNPRGRSVFYSATSVETCLSEIRVQNGWLIATARFVATRPLIVVDLRCLEHLVFPQDILEPDYEERAEWIGILRGLPAEFARPSWPGDDALAYLAPQYFAAYLAQHAKPKIQGIAYPSTQRPSSEHFNVALFEGWALTHDPEPVLKIDPAGPRWVRSTRVTIEFSDQNVARPAKSLDVDAAKEAIESVLAGQR